MSCGDWRVKSDWVCWWQLKDMYSKNIYCGLNALKTSWNDTSGCTCHRMMQSCCKNPVFIVSFWDVKFLRPNPLWKQFCEEKDAALAHRDNQIEALEFTNEEERQAHQQEMKFTEKKESRGLMHAVADNSNLLLSVWLCYVTLWHEHNGRKRCQNNA